MSNINNTNLIPSFKPSNGTGTYNPGSSFKISSGFGARINPKNKSAEFHPGIDFAAPIGTPIPSPATGIVWYSGLNKAGYGNTVVIKGADGNFYLMAHMNGVGMPAIGSNVSQGQTIGQVGVSGLTTGPHVHYEVLPSGAPVNNSSGGAIGVAASNQNYHMDPGSITPPGENSQYLNNLNKNSEDVPTDNGDVSAVDSTKKISVLSGDILFSNGQIQKGDFCWGETCSADSDPNSTPGAGEAANNNAAATNNGVGTTSGSGDANNGIDPSGTSGGNAGGYGSGNGSGGDGDGGGEGSGGSDDDCVCTNSILPDGLLAGDVVIGTTLQLADEKTLEPSTGIVGYSKRTTAPGFRITTRAGATLVCSDTAPIPTPEGVIRPQELLGKLVPIRLDVDGVSESRWDPVTAVDAVGQITVQHISVGNKCFWAGEKPGAYLLHHNKFIAVNGDGSGNGNNARHQPVAGMSVPKADESAEQIQTSTAASTALTALTSQTHGSDAHTVDPSALIHAMASFSAHSETSMTRTYSGADAVPHMVVNRLA